MDVDPVLLRALATLEQSATDGPWRHQDGRILAARGRLVAVVGSPDRLQTQIESADAELIVGLRNAGAELIEEIWHLQGVIDRLIARVRRLEGELYGG
jgi:hypothetical protein